MATKKQTVKKVSENKLKVRLKRHIKPYKSKTVKNGVIVTRIGLMLLTLIVSVFAISVVFLFELLGFIK